MPLTELKILTSNGMDEFEAVLWQLLGFLEDLQQALTSVSATMTLQHLSHVFQQPVFLPELLG